MATKFKNGIYIDGGNADAASGQVYKINGTEVLSSTKVLGLTVTSTTGTLTVANGKTLTASNSITLAGTDSTTMTFPSTSATIARTDAAQTFTGNQTVRAASTQDSVIIAGRAGGSNSYAVTITPTTLTGNKTLTLPDTTGTVVTTGDTGSVTSTMITDGTIVNGDISASAGIVDTKLDLSAATTNGVTPSSTAANKIVSAGTTVSSVAISTTNKVVDQNSFSAYLNPVNTSFGESMPRWSPSNNIIISSGTVAATRIMCLKTGTLQFLSMWHAINATNGTNNDADYRLCAWNSSGTLIGVSANIKDALISTSAASGTGWVGSGTGGSNNQIFAALTAVSGQSLAVNAGDVIYGGVAAYMGTGGSPVAAGWAGRSSSQVVTRYDPIMALAITSGYTGGNPGNFTTTLASFNISSSGTFNINRIGTTNQSPNVLYTAAW